MYFLFARCSSDVRRPTSNGTEPNSHNIMSSKNFQRQVIGKCREDQLKVDVLLSKSMEKFNNDLYTTIACYEAENFTMSGLSVYLALSMCSLGAKENTAKEMLNVLHMDKTSYLPNLKNMIAYFHDVEDIKLGLVNKIYASKSIVVKETFKSDVNNKFLSDIENVDFVCDVEETVDNINQWCSEQTCNKIKNILSIDDIDPLTRMVILNAVYFKSLWQSEFEVYDTSFQPFHVSESITINVPMMFKSNMFMYKYLTDVDAECVGLPYKNPDFLFIVIKPKKINGLRYLEHNLDKIDLNYQEFNTARLLAVHLPKFKIETTLDLNKYLKKLGMIEMFTTEANFEGISEKPKLSPPLHVAKTLQKSFVEVNERGTEAAAVTYMQLRGGGIADYQFNVNCPFLYRVVNIRHNVTLFSGRVVSPKYD